LQGWIKKKTTSAAEQRGLREIRDKVKNQECLVFKTDKSGKLAADTVTNYEETLKPHVQDSTKINAKKVRDIEKKCNSHVKQFNKMFRVWPVCSAKQAPNSRLGHFLSRVINKFSGCEEINTECRSKEEMRAAFESFKLDKETRTKIISMDVKALYAQV
jgi:heme oxygenase